MDSETARALIAAHLIAADAALGTAGKPWAQYLGFAQEILEASYRDFPPPANAVRPPEPPADLPVVLPTIPVAPNMLVLQPMPGGDVLLMVSRYLAPSLGAVIDAAAKGYAPTDPNRERWLHVGEALLAGGVYSVTTTFT